MSTSNKPYILFIFPVKMPFVKRDIEILRKYFEVIEYHFQPQKSFFGMLKEQVKLLLWLFRHITKAHFIYIWFCDYHALLPVLFAKIKSIRSYIVVGGYDGSYMPTIDYGVFNKPLRAKIVTAAYKNASLIMPVDESLELGFNQYTGLKTGLKSFISDLKTPIKIIPTSYDSDVWKMSVPSVPKQNIVLSVGAASTIQTFKRKGFDLLIEVAKKMPDVRFKLVGIKKELYLSIQEMIPSNVEVIAFLPQEQLLDYYSESKVYCQLSLNEGLPVSLCEAMLCECVPVGSAVNGIPKAIGDCGFILEQKDVEQAVSLIRKALESDHELGKKARNRMQQLFPKNLREEMLLQVIQSNSSS